MARKLGQIIARGPNVWLVRIYQGTIPERDAQVLEQTIHGSFRESQRLLNLKPQHQPDRADQPHAKDQPKMKPQKRRVFMEGSGPQPRLGHQVSRPGELLSHRVVEKSQQEIIVTIRIDQDAGLGMNI
jgi:hypothetical protein